MSVFLCWKYYLVNHDLKFNWMILISKFLMDIANCSCADNIYKTAENSFPRNQNALLNQADKACYF